MGPRNDDLNLRLTKMVKSGFLPDVQDSEVEILTKESQALFGAGFDANRCVYNLKPIHLQRTRAALAKSISGVSFANLAFAGDSTVGGVGAGIALASWPDHFGNILANKGYTHAGSGFVAAQKASAKDTRWTYLDAEGWWSLSGSDNMIVNSTTATPAVFTSTNTGTKAIVWYSNKSGTFTISLDGGAAVTVTGTGASTMQAREFTGLANTTHSFSIIRTSGSAQIFGAEVQSNTVSGLRLLNGGIGGMKSFGLAQTDWYQLTAIMSKPENFNADCVFLMTEVNDAGNAIPVSTYKAQFQQGITSVKTNGSDVVIVTSLPTAGNSVRAYTQALYELADENDIPLIDIQTRWTYEQLNGLGLMSDGLHPKAAGYREVAKLIDNALDL